MREKIRVKKKSIKKKKNTDTYTSKPPLSLKKGSMTITPRSVGVWSVCNFPIRIGITINH